jgi:RsmE family RNA methyltransferase
MRIEPPQRTEAFFAERLRAERDGGAEAAWECWIADPNGLPLVAKSLPTHGLSVAIGPEGGWTDQELAWADRADFTRVSLGKRILRIETAAALVAARCCD